MIFEVRQVHKRITRDSSRSSGGGAGRKAAPERDAADLGVLVGIAEGIDSRDPVARQSR
jgi:hypothetical protein